MKGSALSKYKQICEDHKEVPLFLSHDWLRALEQHYSIDVLFVETNHNVQGILPYILKKKKGFEYITMPPLTPYMGPWFFPPEDGELKGHSRISFELEVMRSLIEGLPKGLDEYHQNFHPSIQNWLPFYWKGFEQSTRYTYTIPRTIGQEEAYERMDGSTRRQIKKAHENLVVEGSSDPEGFWELVHKDRKDRNIPLDHDLTYFLGIDEKMEQVDRRTILLARDKSSGKVASFAYFVNDTTTTYYLLGGTLSEFKNSGGMSLLLWEMISRSIAQGRQFDLEGSMLPNVERFFRGFGAELTPYFEVKRTYSSILKGIRSLQNK